jgi:hypothetical protein
MNNENYQPLKSDSNDSYKGLGLILSGLSLHRQVSFNANFYSINRLSASLSQN